MGSSASSPPAGTLVYSTYHGGTGMDTLEGIGVDAAGNVNTAGSTRSTNLPVLNAWRPTSGGRVDAFFSRFSAAGSLLFCSYFGGSGNDAGRAVAVTAVGRGLHRRQHDLARLPGRRRHPAGLRRRAWTPSCSLVSPTGALAWSTYYGGTRSERGRALALNQNGKLIFSGQTFSPDMPLLRPAQPRTGGNRDTFVVELDPPYTAFTYATYLGGSNNDEGSGVAVDRVGRVFTAGAASYPSPGALGASDAFIYGISSGLAGVDTDGDGLDDDWETQFGTDPNVNDAAADPDGDGFTNAQERANNTHPTGYFTRYLAEGSTGAFFDDRIALFNPGLDLATVVLRFQRDAGAEIQQVLAIPSRSRATVNPETIVGLENAAFATVIESNQSVVVDRTMTWDGTGFGSHAETSIEQPATTWYLAEGSTAGNFDLYYLLQNPNASAGAGHDHLPPPERRSGDEVLHGQPAQPPHHQHRHRDRLHRAAGHRAHAAEHRRLGEDRDQRRADPGRARDVHDGQRPRLRRRPRQRRRHRAADQLVPGRRRDRLVLRSVHPAGQPDDDADDGARSPTCCRAAPRWCASTAWRRRAAAPSTSTRSPASPTSPRRPSCARSTPRCRSSSSASMWWPDGNWTEAHNSAGAVVTSPTWALADGEVGGAFANQTFVLVANTSAFTAQVRVTAYFEDQGSPLVGIYNIPANSRFNVDYSNTIAQGRRFSVLVEGIPASPSQVPQLVVERAMYLEFRQHDLGRRHRRARDADLPAQHLDRHAQRAVPEGAGRGRRHPRHDRQPERGLDAEQRLSDRAATTSRTIRTRRTATIRSSAAAVSTSASRGRRRTS